MANNCDKLLTWVWHCSPKCFSGPIKYTLDNISTIPTGSLYFASKKGPLSEISKCISNSPYDIIGIVFESKTIGREGMYVYTIETDFIDNNQTNKVIVLKLDDLIKDNNIESHAILPIKDFNSQQNIKHLNNIRNNIFKDLFKTYRSIKPDYDLYQTLRAIMGLPVDLKRKNAFTAAELIGLILFQAGLISDEIFVSTDNNSEVIVSLITPKKHYLKYNKYNLKKYLDELDDNPKQYHDQSSNYYTYEEEDYTNEPLQKCVYINRNKFKMLRTTDFLLENVFCQQSKQNINLDKLIKYGKNFLNKLQLNWYHHSLIPLELCNEGKYNCEKRIEKEYSIIKDILSKLDRTILSVDTKLLHKICVRTSQLGLHLHNLASECDIEIEYSDKKCNINKYKDEDEKEYNFLVNVNKCDQYTDYMIILHKYMWDKDWKYQCKKPNRKISNKIKTLISDLLDLKEHTPSELSNIYIIVNCLLEQAHELYKTIKKDC